MESKICLDTDVVVNFLRGNKQEAEFIRSKEESADLAITYITLFELYYGAYKSSKKKDNVEAISNFLNRIKILNFTEESTRKAGELLAKLEKEGNIIEFRDLLIGTIALVDNYSMKTGNIKHFSKIDGLKILT
ncbi:PIN domain nuclease [Candidatus Woesearchaeota archaeon]|nr:PIN domain nuclease [Candidatus Woesearchaeota archaeon]|tara:strand:+ start:1139 stop:1537 length:399 start_codon:yes stop_codon:yes gene_type:complete